MRFTNGMLGGALLALSVVGCGGAGGGSEAEPATGNQTETASGLGFNLSYKSNTITVAVAGTGKVVGVPGVINCGNGATSCTDSFAKYTSVVLTATPASGATFLGWGGACSGVATTCTVNNGAARSVSAQFGAPTAPPVVNYTLNVVTGQGGRVTSSPAGIDCGGSTTQCSAKYANGTGVALTALPLSGYTFVGWNGACAGTSTACTVSMSADKSATATFASTATASGSAHVKYTDLDSGPNTGGKDGKGAFVTLYGKGFGATRGTAAVTVGGGAVDNYPVWSDEKIVIQLGANARTGDIVVTNAAGQASNGIPFTVRDGQIYFVALNGSGNGAYATPMAPTSIYNAIAPGDIYYLRGGTYTGMYGVVGWNDFAFVLGASKKGVAGKPVAFTSYPNETAELSGHNGGFGLRDSTSVADYVTIANFRMRCLAQCIYGGAITNAGAEQAKSGARGVRLVGNVMSGNYSWNTMTGLITVGSDGWRLYGNEIKDTGTTPSINNNHAIYIQVGASDIDVGWNYLHDLRMGHLIQVHTDTAFKFENVRIHDNVITAANPMDSRGINIGAALPGTYGSIYNNVLYNIGQDFSAVAIYSGDWNILNNTFHNVNASSGMLWLSTQYFRPTAVIRNNIFYSNGTSPYVGMLWGTTAGQVTMSNNLYYNKGAAPTNDTAPVVANPLFINATAGNYRLQSTSPAIDKGSSAAGTVVTKDVDGNSRPQNGAFDIGAFERTR